MLFRRSRALVPTTAVISAAVLAGAGLAPAFAQAADRTAPPAAAEVSPNAVPGGEPWVVSVGDSFISGEAGRWAGNESLTTSGIDALGRAAYWDAGDRESIERCHRSKSAAIHIGVVRSLNLACSGAITSTRFDADGNFKPGIDFYDQGGRKGQALMLQEFASQNNVKMVALSIGGNDFHFADIVSQCVKDYLVSLTSRCQDSATVKSYISESAADRVRQNTAGAILNVASAMENAGYADADWTLVLQLYPQPLPVAGDMRYDVLRQTLGGCGFGNADLDWAAATLLPLVNDTLMTAALQAQAQRPSLRVEVMDSSRAFGGRQLCHDAVSRVGTDGGVANWQDQGAADRSEWVMEINIINAFETYQQESLHPNFWGQLALRNCYRQVWNGGNVQGGACQRAAAGGVTADCEPNMTLVTAGGRTAAATAAETRASKARVRLRCPGISLKSGEESVLRGRVTPAGSATTVTYQVRWDGTSWKSKGTSAVKAKGHYSFPIVIPRSAPAGRTYEWRVIAKSGTKVVATSGIRRTLVR